MFAVLIMSQDGPVSGVRMKNLASRKVLICPMEGVDGKSQKDEPGWQLRHAQEDDHFGDWQILGIALSHVFVYFHQSSPRHVIVFPFSAMFLSSSEGKKLYLGTVLRNFVTPCSGKALKKL